jgi:hypothetical protein
MLICVIPGPPNSHRTTKPPTNAPAMPIKIVIMIPPGSGPGITHLASTPAMSPITINATMPMRFHLPRITHFLLPPDGIRKRNITDAVPHATIARFTLHPPRINTKEALFLRVFSGEQALQSRPHEGQGEEYCGAVEQGMDLAGPAAGEFDQDVRDKTEPYTVGDVEGQR